MILKAQPVKHLSDVTAAGGAESLASEPPERLRSVVVADVDADNAASEASERLATAVGAESAARKAPDRLLFLITICDRMRCLKCSK